MHHPITLNVSENNWQLFMLRKADKGFHAFEEKVLERDQHTCLFCGFSSKHFLEVINFDNNYFNNKLSNLITACPFCAQCFLLESVGNGYGGGVLAHVPDMTQNELNGLCHQLFFDIACGTEHMQDAKNIYRDLKLRIQLVEKHLGEGLSNPALYGRLMVEANLADKAQSAKISDTLRLLPAPAFFAQEMAAWLKEAAQ